ncbi:acetyl/propionyl/methylcrotonyl-CoA carboxylase subunit alpha [Corynebacterium coyleae]|uniref:acetyl/propionyl/methylcrotonyl-CoA carboxylase subunit alpha n=1 Tax=Corynebacterium coyleae TaxID=53374 RepID=UPI00254D7102|nr:biotin carboxylase N-terminal domain-containing protein [Corynebacterium coyleae]MDK8663582.1 biotin carboxylase N-terminal domain-containing protein [Corynebacterium coyleae]MDK8706582.1 biotin carboxylase N-terminal domain-containing protein [Corynebacterium coyleae]MDK8733384.1 biotin carboxylase N-terminal domain-containing protein [Corynebacterium coyleae]MDK8892580.1 biotin carboxylase N-terminal domain-containing protein [Corynebacterium coyleae]
MTLNAVLIANRGEIAVRIARTARDLGIRSIAVYSEPDTGALHTQVADEAYLLPGKTSAETYMNIPALIEIAHRAGADCLHPGYGFLSENADFARTVEQAGLTWIGPSPDAIELLGDKLSARALAVEANAPLAPGTGEPLETWEQARDFAEEHGMPIAIKAAFGGGGRGLKVVFDEADIEEGFASAGREAREAFGRGECYVEKFLTHPRHVEAQVLADAHGNVAVLATRDCSTQRRFQKLIEEAPAPFLTDEQRNAIEEGAREIIRKANYQSAGTVEYIVSEDGTVSFLEVNTRVQVEHPVTEAVTGVDIIAEQFRIADGLPLSFVDGDSVDPQINGHAFEFRINAEDVTNGFAPSPGTVTRFDVPTGPGVRVDTGVLTGGQVPPYYDSLMGKLIVWGPNRDTALRRAEQSLSEFTIEGVRTVIPFHRDMVVAPELTGDTLDVYTDWVDHNYSPSQRHNNVDIEHIYDERRNVVVEIDGKLHTIGFPVALLGTGEGNAAPAQASTPAADAAGAVTTKYEATIVEWLVADGDVVAKDDPIATIEAMKMESQIKATRDGQISLAAQQGERVKANATIATIS